MFTGWVGAGCITGDAEGFTRECEGYELKRIV